VLAKPGDPVDAGDLIVELRPGAGARVDDARALLAEAVTVSDTAPPPVPTIYGIVA
jgi:hypothetical protein